MLGATRFRRFCGFLFVLCSTLAFGSSGAQGLIDGTWNLSCEAGTGGLPLYTDTCSLAITTSGLDMTAEGSCLLVGSVTLTGTYDPDTREFQISVPSAGVCINGLGASGTVSPDETTIEAGSACGCGLNGLTVGGPLSGSKIVPTPTPTRTPTNTPTITATPTTVPPTCPATPLPGCKTGVFDKGQLMLKKKIGDPTKSILLWKWIKGQPTNPTEFGDPTVDTNYRLCVYDGTGTLLMHPLIPAGGTCGTKPCWKPIGKNATAGFNYKNKFGTPNGVTVITMKAGPIDTAKVIVKGKGIFLNVPGLPLDQSTPIHVQLHNSSTATCFAATYTAPPVGVVSSEKFKDKND
jgi:hypothetical protein